MHARRARQKGATALILASMKGHLEVVNALLSGGADKDAQSEVMG
jgi:ankyrin repeat protein